MSVRIDSFEKLFSKQEWHQAEREQFEQAVGWRFGLIFGLVVVLVGWGWDAYELQRAASELFGVKLLLVACVYIPMMMIAGVLSGGARRSWRRKLAPWIILSALAGIVSALLSFQGVSIVASLLDPAIGGIAIQPLVPAIQERLPLIALFGGIIGFAAAVAQAFATSWAWDSSSLDNRMTLASWSALLIGVPLALVLGALYDGSLNSQMRAPAQLSHRIIQLALTTPPDADFRKMDTLTMLDYVSTLSWRDRFSPRYVHHLADFDRATLKTAYIDAEFDNGFAWRCQSVRNGDGLIDCVDVRAQYVDWMRQFVRTGVIVCEKCVVSLAPAATIWQTQNANRLGEPQQITFTHHSGGVIVMRADVSGGTVECRFVGASPTIVHDCAQK